MITNYCWSTELGARGKALFTYYQDKESTQTFHLNIFWEASWEAWIFTAFACSLLFQTNKTFAVRTFNGLTKCKNLMWFYFKLIEKSTWFFLAVQCLLHLCLLEYAQVGLNELLGDKNHLLCSHPISWFALSALSFLQQRVGLGDARSQISFPCEETCFFLIAAYLEQTAKERGFSDFCNAACWCSPWYPISVGFL